MAAAPAQEDEGFTSVTHKKPARARKGKNRAPPRERTIQEKLATRAEGLRESDYLKQCRALLRDALVPPAGADVTAAPPFQRPECVVCLGLGSIADSLKAQEQYLLLKEVLEELEGVIDPEAHTEFYDPVFSLEDAAFLSSEGHSVLSAEHPLRLTRPTLLYIPHGPRTLFDALLRANWTSPDQLRRVVILGNRLDLYDDPTYSGSTRQSGGKRGGEKKAGGDELGESAEWVGRAANLFHIVPLPDTKEHLQAFNDLALEWVDPAKAAAQEESFWRKEEGEKDDGEDEGIEVKQDQVDEAAKELEKLELQ
ncbi:hypothetical protein JCM10207_000610 [Rhodosporidiobolus poonsookiae]